MWTRMGIVGFGIVLVYCLAAPSAGRRAIGQVPAAKAEGGTLKFEVYTDAANKYRWRLKAANGAILCTSGQGYANKADCKKGVDRLKMEAGSGKLTFEVYADKSKEHRW